MDPFVEATLDWSPLRFSDLEEVAELCRAIEYFDDPMERTELDDLVRAFRRAPRDPGRDAVVGRDKGSTIVAFGWNQSTATPKGRPTVWLTGGIHPAWRHQSIGNRLLRWQLARAQECYHEMVADPSVRLSEPLWAGAYVETSMLARVQLMLDCGLQAERWATDLRRPLVDPDGDPLPLPGVPDITPMDLVPFHPALSEQVRAAHNEAFATRRGSHEVGREAWEASLTRPEARPEWSWVAMDAHEVVGYALNSVAGDEGWTDRLGVRPMWRRHHLGQALLVASMRSFRQAGVAGAGLGVDTEDPETSLGLYEHLGYVAEDSVVLYGTTIGE